MKYYKSTPRSSAPYYSVIVFLILILCVYLANEIHTVTISNCKVLALQQQHLIKGSKEHMSTEIRYLIITDKETFICESSWLNGKFNNSDVFFRLMKDSSYTLRVAGFGKSLITDYRNILEIK